MNQSIGSSTCTVSNSGSDIRRYLFFLLLTVVIPNTPIGLASSHFELFRPLINYDYIIAAVLISTRYTPFGIILLFASMSSDIMSLILQIFPAIQHPSNLLELAPFIFLAPTPFIITVVLTVLYMLATVALLFIFRRSHNLKHSLIVTNIALFLFLYDIISKPVDYFPDFNKKEYEASLVSSQILNYFKYQSLFYLKSYDRSATLNTIEYQGEAAAWFRTPEKELPDRLLLVINESWGANKDEQINKTLLAPILKRRDDLIGLKYGDITFRGGTLSGELRELCSLWPNNFNLSSTKQGFENCLPKRLNQAGYATHAMHGATGRMYHRLDWYPRAGFEKMTFLESKQWPAMCKSFPGACDLDMRDEVTHFFTAPGKRFMYWLTLNTHVMYDLNDLRNDTLNCAAMNVEEDTATCRYLKLQSQFFHGLADIIGDPNMRGVSVRVIGDHTPPITNSAEQNKYFKEDAIGWMEFTIPIVDNKPISNPRANSLSTISSLKPSKQP